MSLKPDSGSLTTYGGTSREGGKEERKKGRAGGKVGGREGEGIG